MEIILMCAHASGSVAFSADRRIEGLPVEQRRYEIVDHVVRLSGFPDAVLHHDADELLKNPLYRMPTPAEQDAMAEAERQAAAAQENQQSQGSGEQQGNDVAAGKKQKAVNGG